ncbi:MAG: double zinc ribbon domain-containing protein [Desulfatiglandales bacterium]
MKSPLIGHTGDLFRQFIELIYPPRCLLCGAFLRQDRARADHRDLPFCLPCFQGLTPVLSPLCPICGVPHRVGSEDRVCENCLRRRPHFEKTRAPYLYTGGLMTLIHQFKYGGKSNLAGSLGPLLASFARTWIAPRPALLVMPVPLHPKRLRERGFNQSLLLARHLARALEAELDFLTLRRIRYTQPQTGLKSDERRKNVRRAFGIQGTGNPLKGRTILLVDDVATTGNTLNECARMLKRSGARQVFGLVLARTMG